jgi:hypothetical protein
MKFGNGEPHNFQDFLCDKGDTSTENIPRAGKMAFIEADAVPAPIFRSYK